LNSAVCTIVVPAYNAGSFLRWTLDSIVAQTTKSFRCIVVNDGSTDNTREIAEEFARRDKRIQIINHGANSGLSAARNTGLRATTSPFVCFLDADDLMMRDSLELRLAPLLGCDDEHVIGSYCGSVTIREDTKKPPRSSSCILKPVDFLRAGTSCPFNANQPLFFADKLCRLGGFNEKMVQAEDYEFWMRSLRAGYRFVAVKRHAVTYRSRSRSMIRQQPLKHLDIAIQLNKASYMDLPAQASFDADITTYTKKWPVYRQQADLAGRILSFVGMEAARRNQADDNADLNDLGVMLRTELPDLHQVLSRNDIRLHLKTGIARFHTEPQKSLEIKFPQTTALLDRLLKTALQEPLPSKVDSTDSTFPFTDSVEFSGWNLGKTRQPSIVFLLQKDYHLETLAPVLRHLATRNIACHVVDLSSHCGDRFLRSKAVELDIPLIGLSPFMLGLYAPKVIVALNDWDPSVRAIFGAAQAAGIKTAAIVEGIQDYWDADINRDRGAYRMADAVLLPGSFDKRYFSDSNQEIHVCGLPRIAEMRSSPPLQLPSIPRVLINSNFSYGVLVEHRDTWLTQAVEACEQAGLDWVISRHPADLGTLHQDKVTPETFDAATRNSTVVVQRFASGILEGLAYGRQVIYFNPHAEQVDKFKDPMGAYPIAENTQELTRLLENASGLAELHRHAWPDFLDTHCANREGMEPAIAIARTLGDMYDQAASASQAVEWRVNLRAVDMFSRSMFDTRKILANVRPTYGRNTGKVEGREGRFADVLMSSSVNTIVTRSKLKLIAEAEKRQRSEGASIRNLRRKNLREVLLHIDDHLEIFYHKTKDTRLIGPVIRQASRIYDHVFKK